MFRIIHKLFYQKDAFDFMLSKTHRVELINLGSTFITDYRVFDCFKGALSTNLLSWSTKTLFMNWF